LIERGGYLVADELYLSVYRLDGTFLPGELIFDAFAGD